MLRSAAENEVKKVLIGLLKNHDVTVDRAQEIAAGVIGHFDEKVSPEASFEMSDEQYAEVIGFFVESYPELSPISEDAHTDSVEALEHSLADDFSDLIEQGNLDAVISLGGKVDVCGGDEPCIIAIEKEAEELLHVAGEVTSDAVNVVGTEVKSAGTEVNNAA